MHDYIPLHLFAANYHINENENIDASQFMMELHPDKILMIEIENIIN
jgi:hypothetical protein